MINTAPIITGDGASLCRRPVRLRFVVLMSLTTLSIVGCAQTAIIGKILFGDPKVTNAFARTTGESLKKGGRVAVVCTTPDAVHSQFDTLSVDLQGELTHRMSRRGIDVVDEDEVTAALDKNGGIPDPQLLAEELDCQFLLHIDVEYFSHLEQGSKQLFRGHSRGNAYGYAVRTEESGRKFAEQVFEQEFNSEYPTTYPVSVDQTPEKVFRQRFIDHLSDQLGRMFYDYRTSEAFSH